MSQQQRIVCTGNEAFGLEVRRLLLEAFGYHARVLPDCAAASRAITQDRTDLVILDYSELTKWETECIRSLRAAHPAQRILLLAPAPYVEADVSALVDCVLMKGASPEEFREAIHACIGSNSGGRRMLTLASLFGALLGTARRLLKRHWNPLTSSSPPSTAQIVKQHASSLRSSAR